MLKKQSQPNFYINFCKIKSNCRFFSVASINETLNRVKPTKPIYKKKPIFTYYNKKFPLVKDFWYKNPIQMQYLKVNAKRRDHSILNSARQGTFGVSNRNLDSRKLALLKRYFARIRQYKLKWRILRSNKWFNCKFKKYNFKKTIIFLNSTDASRFKMQGGNNLGFLNSAATNLREKKRIIRNRRKKEFYFKKYQLPALLRKDVEHVNRYLFSRNRALKVKKLMFKYKSKIRHLKDGKLYQDLRNNIIIGELFEIMSLPKLKIWFSDKNSRHSFFSRQNYLNKRRAKQTMQLLKNKSIRNKVLNIYGTKMLTDTIDFSRLNCLKTGYSLINLLNLNVQYLKFIMSCSTNSVIMNLETKQNNFIKNSKFDISFRGFEKTAPKPRWWYKMLRRKFAKAKKYRKRQLVQMKYWLKQKRSPLTNLPINSQLKLKHNLTWFMACSNVKGSNKPDYRVKNASLAKILLNSRVKSNIAKKTKVRSISRSFNTSTKLFTAAKQQKYLKCSTNLNFNLRYFRNFYKQYLFRNDELAFDEDSKWGLFDKSRRQKLRNFSMRPSARRSTPWMEQLIFRKKLYKPNFFKLYNRDKDISSTRRIRIYKLYNKILHNKYSVVKYSASKKGGVRSFALQRVLTKIVLPFFGKLKRKQLQMFWAQVKSQKSVNRLRSNAFLFSLTYRLDNFIHNINWAPNAFWARKMIRKGWIYVLSPKSEINYKHGLDSNELFPLKPIQKHVLFNSTVQDSARLKNKDYTARELNYKRRLQAGDIIYINPKIKLHNLLFFTKRIKWNRQPTFPTVEFNTNQTIARIVNDNNITPVKYSRNHRANKFNLRLTIN